MGKAIFCIFLLIQVNDSLSIYPAQKDLIVLGDVYRVFAVDALASSHPLSSREDEINKPEQISELFDAISYSKVSSLFVLDICCINVVLRFNTVIYTLTKLQTRIICECFFFIGCISAQDAV